MSRCQTSSAVRAEKLIPYATVVGRLTANTCDDYMKLVRLAYEFRKAVTYAARMVVRGVNVNEALKELRGMLNKAYGDSAYKVARAIVKGCRLNGGDPRHIKVRGLFIVSEGEASRSGNRNVRVEATDVVRIKYPFDGSWLTFKARFGERYLPLVQELVELAKDCKVSYGARITFRGGRVYLHLSVPVELYLKHFRKGDAKGGLVAGLDLNSDRINMAIVDRCGRIRDIKAEWFPEVVCHGYPRGKARARRLEALARLLNYAYHHGVGRVVFEDLLAIKHRTRTGSPSANRRITRFAKKQLLRHGILMAMKYGFEVLLVNPRGTTRSKQHDEVARKYGLDRHTASAYMVALKGLNLP